MEIKIKPVGKPRQTQRDRWKERPVVLRYRRFADDLRKETSEQDFQLSERVGMQFYMPMPKSWSGKKKDRMNMHPHQQRPDIDNLIKSVMDALLAEDKKIYYIVASKWWNYEGRIKLINIG